MILNGRQKLSHFGGGIAFTVFLEVRDLWTIRGYWTSRSGQHWASKQMLKGYNRFLNNHYGNSDPDSDNLLPNNQWNVPEIMQSVTIS